MSATLELFLLDAGNSSRLVVLGHCDQDVVIERLRIDKECKRLAAYRDVLDGVILGTAERPTVGELRAYGESLFRWLFRGDLRTLYGRVPHGMLSIQVLSTQPVLQSLPWEYIALPDRQPAPHRERCVVRVLPVCGLGAPQPIKKGRKIRVLFVSADPMDQTNVPWEEVKTAIGRAFQSQLPHAVEMTIIEGVTRDQLRKAIQTETFDVFHFLGHGVLRNNEGHLVLVDGKTQQSDYMSASQLATLLSGKNVCLALLSACLTGAGNAADDFSIVATALLRAGLPAVVANHVSISTKSIATFVGSLYAKLLSCGNIDEAVMEARVQLATDLAGTTGTGAVIEWGIPSLYRLSSAGQLLS